jgi:hypothetical protein
MKLYVGLDVSLETTAICVIDEDGRRVKEDRRGVGSPPPPSSPSSTARIASEARPALPPTSA